MNGSRRRSPATTNATEARPGPAPRRRSAARRGTPGCGAAVAAVMIRATPTVSAPAPTPSMRVSCPASRGTTRSVSTRTPTVTGTSAPKIARQPNASATRPPTGGPMAWPMPLAAPQAPMTRLRRCGGKLRASVPMTATGTAAQPSPCSAAAGHHQPQRRGHRGADRADEQHRQREDERAPPPQPVADPAGQRHGDGEHEHRGRGDQHALGDRRVEVGDDLPQRHVDDVVADRPQHRGAEQRGEQPPAAGRVEDAGPVAAGLPQRIGRCAGCGTRRRLRHRGPLATPDG